VGAVQEALLEVVKDWKVRARSDGTKHDQWCLALYAQQMPM
jgi:hypothetical protein